MSVLPRTSLFLLPAFLSGALISSSAFALEGSWQAGINVGLSNLQPDTDGSGFTLEDDRSTAVSAYLSLDITPIFSAEIAFTDLGEAELSQDQDISYQAISVGATAYVWGATAAQNRGDGISAYLRLGLSSIDNESDIALNESNNNAVWLGAGVQYPISNNWGLRLELTSYDGDAQALLAGAFWRVGGQPKSRSSRPAPDGGLIRVPAPTNDVVVAPVAPPQPVPTPTPAPIAESVASCPSAAQAKIQDSAQCNLLNSVVAGLEFVGNTAEIAPGSNAALDQIANAMLANPAAGVEIRVHTQSSGNVQQDAERAAQRARSVARYLVQKGVSVGQLGAKAFGASQPLGDDRTTAGRKINNRVELSSF